ncbi:hypothetical protein BX616_010671, partial [Lobosporangium transversale]
STFGGAGRGSDQTLSDLTSSQGSLASSGYESTRTGSSLSVSSRATIQQTQPLPPPPQPLFSTSATSAIFGTAFVRQNQHEQQQHAPTPSSLVMNTSYFTGPRAPQYIPSPSSSPVSPKFSDTETSGLTTPDESRGRTNDDQDPVDPMDIHPRAQSKPSPAANEILLQQDHHDMSEKKNAAGIIPDVPESHGIDVHYTGVAQIMPSQELLGDHIYYDDTIKVDVTELYENFGQKKPILVERWNEKIGNQWENEQSDPNEEEEEDQEGVFEGQDERKGMTIALEDTHSSESLPMRLPELSFSNNDLSSLWTSGPASPHDKDLASEDIGKRSRAHTFHDHSESQEPQVVGPSSDNELGLSKNPVAFPPKKLSPLSQELTGDDIGRLESAQTILKSLTIESGGPNVNQPNHNNHPRSDRKRLGLVISNTHHEDDSGSPEGLDMESESKLQNNALDLPKWDLAPLSPPVEVKEATTASATASPLNSRRGSLAQQNQHLQDTSALENQHVSGIMSPSSATVMTTTTPLTAREARILAGREALLKMSPDRSRIQRALSVSSTASSSTSSSVGRTASIASRSDRQDSETLVEMQGSQRRTSLKSQYSRSSQQTKSSGGAFGVFPERGQLEDIPAEKLIFPDQSIRPIPLKAYRIRKMTIPERIQTYAQACEEFTRARTGLDVWVLRCMMQDRPALMKEPPAIVKAVASGTGRMTPTSLNFSSSSVNLSNSSHGLSARIKNAGKRLSVDMPGGSHPNSTESTGQGSIFYKQKITKSAVELGSWSSGRVRGISNSGSNTAIVGTPPAPSQEASGRRSSIIGPITTPSPQQHQQHQQNQQQSRSSSYGSSNGLAGIVQGKKNNVATANSPLSGSIRSRRMSEVQAGSQLHMAGRESPSKQHLQQADMSNSSLSHPVPGDTAQASPTLSSSPIPSLSSTSPVGKGRPLQRSHSSHYTRRPPSMLAITGQNRRPDLIGSTGDSAASNVSAGPQSSSSFGSASSRSVTESLDLRTSATTSSTTLGLKQQRDLQDIVASGRAASNSPTITDQPSSTVIGGGLSIPFADETKSKDELYTPLTSPIMIPVGGFPVFKTSHNNSGHRSSGGWASPPSVGGGSSRPLTYAGPSTPTLGSASSLLMSPNSVSRDHVPVSSQPQQPQGAGSPANERNSTLVPMKDKAEKSNRYSASSFSSIGSFAKYQKKSSKKDRKKEGLEQDHNQQQQQQPLDQRYSVSAASVNPVSASVSDYWTEKSLDKLSDVVPHVDRDRLSIYLQRAQGDEMVAIGLAMSDLRSGLL